MTEAMAVPTRWSHRSPLERSYPLSGVCAIFPTVAATTNWKTWLVPSRKRASLTVLTERWNPKKEELARRSTFVVSEGSYSMACAILPLGTFGS